MLALTKYQLHWRQVLQAQHCCSSILSTVLAGSTPPLNNTDPACSALPYLNAARQYTPFQLLSRELLEFTDSQYNTNSSSPSNSTQQQTQETCARSCRPLGGSNTYANSTSPYTQWRPPRHKAVCCSCDLSQNNSWYTSPQQHQQLQQHSSSTLCLPAVDHKHTPHAAIRRHSSSITSSGSSSCISAVRSNTARSFVTSPSSSSVLSGDSSSSSSSSGPGWVDKYLPEQMRPYAHLMRLDKPIGSWLLAWPGLWTIALAADPGRLPDLWLTSLFAVGAVMMRGAGCTVNDLWDQDIDKLVQRTRSRPLAAGLISQNAALAFLVAQLLASFMILLQLNTYTQVLGWCSLLLVGTYPLMKRITWWPQAFLGLCMNYGVLMGYSAAHGSCAWSVVLPMYAAGVNWTLVYDTIYAHQDTKDDALIGVKSTALLFGDRTKSWATGFVALQNLGLVTAGVTAGLGLPYYTAVAAGAVHQTWQLRSVDLDNGADCMAKFVSNKWYGGILYAGIVADRLLAA